MYGLTKIFYERQIYGRCFYSGFLPQQRGGYGTGIYPEYLRAIHNGLTDDAFGAVPLYNIYSVLVLTFEGDYPENERDTGRIKQAGINILKNPIIIGIVLGLIVALLHNPLPELVNSTVNNVAKMATPLALIGLGAGFEGKKALAKIKPTLWAAFIKLIAQAAIFIPIAAALGFRGEKMVALVSHAGSTGDPELLYHGEKYA